MAIVSGTRYLPSIVLSVFDEPLVDLGVNDHLIACRM